FVIIAVSMTKDFLLSSWGDYVSTFWDWALYLGSFGLFSTLFFLFIRLLPSIATAETKDTAYDDSHHKNDQFEDVRAQGQPVVSACAYCPAVSPSPCGPARVSGSGWQVGPAGSARAWRAEGACETGDVRELARRVGFASRPVGRRVG